MDLPRGLRVRLAFRGATALLAVGYAAVALLAIAVASRGTPLWISEWTARRPAAGALVVFTGFAATAVFVAVAALIVWRRPGSPFALFVSATLFLRGVTLIAGLPQLASDADWAAPATVVRVAYAALVVLLMYVFPDGRFVPRWTAFAWSAWTAWLVVTVPFPQFNPVLAASAPWMSIVIAAVATSGLVAQVLRYRRASSRRQRFQTKWITYGLGIYVVEFALMTVAPVVMPVLADTSAVEGVAFAGASSVAEAIAASCVAITIGIAILRARLFDIDVVLNRTLVHVGATAIVAGTFAALSTVTQRALVEVTGQRSELANVFVALVVGATFAPVRAFLQQVLRGTLEARHRRSRSTR